MWVGSGGWWVVVCGQTLRQVVAQLELELLRPCQYQNKYKMNCHPIITVPFNSIGRSLMSLYIIVYCMLYIWYLYCHMWHVIVTSWSQPIRAQYLDSSRPILLLHSDQTNLLAGEGEVVWDEVERSERRSEPSPRVPGPEQRDIREGYKVGNI